MTTTPKHKRMRDGIIKRGKNTYSFVLELERGSDGKRKQKWITVEGTRKKAEAERARRFAEVQGGTYTEPSKYTVGEFLERWLTDSAKPSVSAKTFERYAEIIRSSVIPALGSMPISKLRPTHIQAFYAQALESGRKQKRKDGTTGLSKRTVLHYHRVLHEALERAVKWQVIPVNPARAVEPPKPERKEARFLDEGRSVWLLNALRGTRLYFPAILAAATGMRRGEILALAWNDIDFELGMMRVVRSLEQTKAGLRMKETKTYRGRPIALPAGVLEALKEQRQIQTADKKLFGSSYQDSGLICCCESGAPWEPDAFSALFSKAARRLGVNASFHSLRHSHASHLLRKGVNPKVVSERLGHSTVTLTMNTYAHVLPGMQEQAATFTDEILEAAFKPTGPAN